ncbi:unnamed protein product [Chondrus crispus]|uniref:Uncharacterized protein n=1 Tax=Chondrus crispus TaxID=2769 RepID=R7QGH9_CHOCR|nr:unnamed protein product [Chondrus crispus]CDF37199.1 unnamed protein product [Chondrus crispus]|eukprot:XP_005717018.1 unnamed protein product [Chondrus crispus]
MVKNINSAICILSAVNWSSSGRSHAAGITQPGVQGSSP